MLFVSLLSLLVFVFLLFEISSNGFLINWDLFLNSWISQINHSFFAEISKIIGVLFDTINLVVLSLLISVFLWLGYLKKQATFFGFTMILTGGLIFVMKELVQRVRPINALVSDTSFAFPSGHATVAVVFFGLLIYLALANNRPKSLKLNTIIFSCFMILLISFTRLYLNLHWFTDVLGGLALGLFILTSSIILRRTLNRKFS